jgi:class 3 adenylate cyclase
LNPSKVGAIMAEKEFKRKLTAILSADVAGYSRLMAEDETATVKTIASYRKIMAYLEKKLPWQNSRYPTKL